MIEKPVPVRYGKYISDYCGACGHDNYMKNEHGNKNIYCGNCGERLDWINMINADEEDNER